jgi:hypothetical protein
MLNHTIGIAISCDDLLLNSILPVPPPVNLNIIKVKKFQGKKQNKKVAFFVTFFSD